jgi:hypothetical protein
MSAAATMPTHPQFHKHSSNLPLRLNCFRFLDLSSELRNEVYKCLLVSHSSLNIANLMWLQKEQSSKDHGLISVKRLGLHPGVLRTCRQVHQEAVGYLYQHNTFFVSEAEMRAHTTPFVNFQIKKYACPEDKCLSPQWRSELHPRFDSVRKLELIISSDKGLLVDGLQQRLQYTLGYHNQSSAAAACARVIPPLEQLRSLTAVVFFVPTVTEIGRSQAIGLDTAQSVQQEWPPRNRLMTYLAQIYALGGIRLSVHGPGLHEQAREALAAALETEAGIKWSNLQAAREYRFAPLDGTEIVEGKEGNIAWSPSSAEGSAASDRLMKRVNAVARRIRDQKGISFTAKPRNYRSKRAQQ